MMTYQQMRRIKHQIMRDDPECIPQGFRRYGPDRYELDVVDARTGYTFLICDEEDWIEHQAAMSLFFAGEES